MLTVIHLLAAPGAAALAEGNGTAAAFQIAYTGDLKGYQEPCG